MSPRVLIIPFATTNKLEYMPRDANKIITW